MDSETGHPVYNHRYAFQDKKNAPFHVVDSRADGRGRVSKSYLVADNIDKLLSVRVEEPVLLNEAGKRLGSQTHAGPIKTARGNKTSSHSNKRRPSHQHRVKVPQNSTVTVVLPIKPPSSASGVTIIPPLNTNHHSSSSSSAPTLSTSTHKHNKKGHHKRPANSDKTKHKSSVINKTDDGQSSLTLSTTSTPTPTVQSTTSYIHLADVEKKTAETTQAIQTIANVVSSTTTAVPPTPTQAEQHTPRATSSSMTPNYDVEVDEDEDSYAEVEDLSNEYTRPSEAIPPIDPIIYEGILGAVQSDNFPTFQPELSVDPITGQPVFTHRYEFRDEVNPAYYVYDANTKTLGIGDYFKPQRYGQGEDKSDKYSAADKKHRFNPFNRPNRPNRPHAGGHAGGHAAQVTAPPATTTPAPVPEMNVERNETQSYYHAPAHIDPNVYQGIVGASQFGFPTFQPVMQPNQQQYGTWMFQGFGYQTPGQLAFQQNFYFPPGLSTQYGSPPMPPAYAMTFAPQYGPPHAVHPTHAPQNHYHSLPTAAPHPSPDYTDRPNYFVTSSKAPLPTDSTTRRHTKPTNRPKPPPPTYQPEAPSAPPTQYPSSGAYQSTHHNHHNRPTYTVPNPTPAYTERPNYFVTSTAAPITTERPNYFTKPTKPSKPSGGHYHHHRPSYAGSTHGTAPPTTPSTTTTSTTEQPNYFKPTPYPGPAPAPAPAPAPVPCAHPGHPGHPSTPYIYHPIQVGGSSPGNQITIAYGPNVFNHLHPTPSPTMYTTGTTTTTTTTQNSMYVPQTTSQPAYVSSYGPSSYGPSYSRGADENIDIRAFTATTKGNGALCIRSVLRCSISNHNISYNIRRFVVDDSCTQPVPSYTQ